MTWRRNSRHEVVIAALFTIGLLMFALVPGAESRQGPAQANKKGETLYLTACSSCHGADGRGAPQYHVGFDLPLPDFTDCSFSSREPDADWVAVAHQGGPVRGFSKLMPAFGKALSFEDLELIVAYIRSFCGNPDWPPGELNLPRSLATEKAYPEDEAVYSLAIDVEGQGAVTNKIVYEKRFGARNQFELTIPFGWEEQDGSGSEETPAGNWVGGLGDVALGVKRAFFHNARTGTIFSATGEIVVPTGDREKGFGKGTTVFEPFVSFGQILPSEFFFQSQAGFELPVDTDRAGREAFWRFSLGRTFTSGQFGRSWSPICEFLGARELESEEYVQWDVVPQIQVTLNQRQHIMANVGVRLPLTDSDVRDTQLLFYLLWDWFDGGFFSGW
ncbi:MAG: c-type cytochrome [Acidobacteria bacterium]|nr:c-type cytochrome [Acidobacteriota bacterium]